MWFYLDSTNETNVVPHCFPKYKYVFTDLRSILNTSNISHQWFTCLSWSLWIFPSTSDSLDRALEILAFSSTLADRKYWNVTSFLISILCTLVVQQTHPAWLYCCQGLLKYLPNLFCSLPSSQWLYATSWGDPPLHHIDLLSLQTTRQK